MELILIANLSHASTASVLCCPHDAIEDNLFLTERDRRPEAKQQGRVLWFHTPNPDFCQNKRFFSPCRQSQTEVTNKPIGIHSQASIGTCVRPLSSLFMRTAKLFQKELTTKGSEKHVSVMRKGSNRLFQPHPEY